MIDGSIVLFNARLGAVARTFRRIGNFGPGLDGFDPSAPLCGRPEWTMTRALRRGASYAQSAVMGSLAAPMTTQVGGHMPSAGSGAGMLAVGDRDRKGLGGLGGVVLKPVQSGERGAREVSFYEAMGAPGALWRGRPVGAATRAEFAGLRRFLCGYHGVVALGEADGTDVGVGDGCDDGKAVGVMVGADVGVDVGAGLGRPVGSAGRRRTPYRWWRPLWLGRWSSRRSR